MRMIILEFIINIDT